MLTLVGLAAALLVGRVAVSEQPRAAVPTSPLVSLAGHTPGSVAHARHAYRLQLAQAAAVSGR
jgi:hypothetical protein